MASYAKGNNTKSRFIESAYQHLECNDYKNLTVRALAQENGYSVAALYKHFDSLKYLLVVASIKFLDEYMERYVELLDGSKDPLQVYLEGWDLFLECAFQRPDIFYRLFWETDEDDLERAFVDYYNSFPDEDPELSSVKFSVLVLLSNHGGKGSGMVDLIARGGKIEQESVYFLNKTNDLIASGLIWAAINEPKPEKQRLMQECRELIKMNISRCIIADSDTVQ